MSLQDAYSSGTTINGFRLTSYKYGQLVAPDPVLAHAYALLWERVVPPSALRRAQELTVETVRSLDPAQIEQAQAFADEAWPRFAAQAGRHANIMPCREYIYQATKP